jgi:hypothetical protein
MYADHADENDYMSGGSTNRRSTDRYEYEDFEGHGHGRQPLSQARIGWLPDTMQHRAGEEPRGVSEPENTFVDDSEPQMIPGPFASDNSFQKNLYHTREPDHIPDHRYHPRPTSGEYVHGVRRSE